MLLPFAFSVQIGSNIGFYTMLFAKRGYDVIAVEPCHECNWALLQSLKAERIRIAESGNIHWDDVVPTRTPTVAVYENAASDSNDPLFFHYTETNPGASWVSSSVSSAPTEPGMFSLAARCALRAQTPYTR